MNDYPQDLKGFNRLAKRIFKIAGAFPLRISMRVKKGILARFANNGVHQNGFQDQFFYSLSSRTKNNTVYLESNDVSDEGIKRTLEHLKKIVQQPAPLKKPAKRRYPQSREFFPFGLFKSSHLASQTIERALRMVRKNRASANGYFSAYERFFYLADSSGLELFHPATSARFGVTVTKGNGKGYFGFFHPDYKYLNIEQITGEALKLAEAASKDEIALKPGRYECILSPRAFLEFIEPLRRHFDKSLYQSGKSVFSKQFGKQIFSEHLTLHDDATHPNQFGVPFDSEGSPKRKTALIERGVLKNLLSEGNNTQGIREHPFDFENLVIAPGQVPLKSMFSKVKKGIFINKLRYHSLVKEDHLEVTGLATAGSVYIENGQIQGQLTHLRYHDSILALLRQIQGLSKEGLLLKDGEHGAALLPYFWIKDFRVV